LSDPSSTPLGRLALVRGRRPTASRAGAIEVRVGATCGGCHAPILVDGLTAETSCPACGHRQPFSVEAWRGLLAPVLGAAPSMLLHETRRAARPGLSCVYSRAELRCPACDRADLDPVAVEAVTGTGAVRCAQCRTEVPVRAAPDGLLEGVTHLVNEGEGPWYLWLDRVALHDVAPRSAPEVGLLDWEGPAQVGADAGGSVVIASERAAGDRVEFLLWSMDASLAVRWLRRDLGLRVASTRLAVGGQALWVADNASGCCLMISCADGRTLHAFDAAHLGAATETRAAAIADGTFVVARTRPAGETIVRRYRDAAGALVATTAELVNALGPSGRMAATPDGALAVAGSDEVTRFDAKGRRVWRKSMRLQPGALPHFDRAGRLWVLGAKRVRRFESDGEDGFDVLSSERDGLPLDGSTLAVAPDGAFWLAAPGGHLWHFGPDGARRHALSRETGPPRAAERLEARHVPTYPVARPLPPPATKARPRLKRWPLVVIALLLLLIVALVVARRASGIP
jgi:hypothetical protein